MQPIGNCSIKETVCSFCHTPIYKKVNLWVLHDVSKFIEELVSSYSFPLVYDGIRLTYAVKTGNLAYWDESGQTNGCTKLKIDATGAASISQYYYFAN